jgi:hypothetical protein
MRAKLGSVITAASLISSLSVFGAINAVAAEGHHAGSSQSGLLPGQSAVEGRMVWADGHGVPGTLVSLYAWPDSKVVAALRPGQIVPRRLVGSAITAASGSYAIRIAVPKALLSSAGKDGIVNLEVFSATGSGFASFSFPRRIARMKNGRLAMGNAERVTLRVSVASRASEGPARPSTPAAHCTGWRFQRSLGPIGLPSVRHTLPRIT